MGTEAAATGPDFSAGISLDDVPEEGTLAGRVGDDPVLLSRFGGELFAVSGACTHYGAALANGLVQGREVRCPWHHACFDLKAGTALRTPALDALDRWRVEHDGDRVIVREKLPEAGAERRPANDIDKVVIVGGGAAGVACASELRKLGYEGAITVLSADEDPPCDRPNLSKDYLAGTAPDEWIPLRGDSWYREQKIDLRLRARVHAIDTAERVVITETGERIAFDRLLLATGAEPRRLEGQGFGRDNVFTLRSFADARAIVEQAKPGTRAAIIGSSFIGLETAAALRKRGVEVEVVSPEQVPFKRVLGAELGRFLQQLHEGEGVRFHLGTAVAGFDGEAVTLADGGRVDADFVLVGVGVSPRTELAEAAGLEVTDGVWVDSYLETSCPGIFAAGDIAAYPDPRTGERVRVEHWVLAERHGQTVAANMLGLRRRFEQVPFFWTEQHGVSIRYVGRAGDWDEVRTDGEIGGKSFIVRYYQGGTHVASASVKRDRENLKDEVAFEKAIASRA